MKRREAFWAVTVQIAVGLSLLVALVGGAAMMIHGDERTTLRLDVGELRSQAHEALELATSARDHRLNHVYVRAQSRQYAGRIDDLAATFASDSDADAQQALAAARALGGALRDLPVAFEDSARIEAIVRRMQRESTIVGALEARLAQ
jgi:hypothetical protein